MERNDPGAYYANLKARAEKAEAKVARVEALAAEHAQCSGCRTPWWLTTALSEPDAAADAHGGSPGCTCAVPCATAHDCSQTPQSVWIDVTAIRPS